MGDVVDGVVGPAQGLRSSLQATLELHPRDE
jgi:hypothetical protein